MKYRCPCGAYRHVGGSPNDPVCPECGEKWSEIPKMDPDFDAEVLKTADRERIGDLLPGENVAVGIHLVVRAANRLVAEHWSLGKARELLGPRVIEPHVAPLREIAPGKEEKLNSGRAIVARHDDEVMRAQVALWANRPAEKDSFPQTHEDALSEKDALERMADMDEMGAAKHLEEYLLSPNQSICDREEWIEAAWDLVAFARCTLTKKDGSLATVGARVETEQLLTLTAENEVFRGLLLRWLTTHWGEEPSHLIDETVGALGVDRPKKLLSPVEQEMFGPRGAMPHGALAVPEGTFSEEEVDRYVRGGLDSVRDQVQQGLISHAAAGTKIASLVAFEQRKRSGKPVTMSQIAEAFNKQRITILKNRQSGFGNLQAEFNKYQEELGQKASEKLDDEFDELLQERLKRLRGGKDES